MPNCLFLGHFLSQIMIEFKNVYLTQGITPLINNINLQLFQGMKIGVVGKNGCGKTSFFHLILRTLEPEQGQINFSPTDLRISSVSQEIVDLNSTAYDYVKSGDQILLALEKAEKEAITEQKETTLAEIHHQMEIHDAYRASMRITQLLNGLGFDENSHHKPVSSFSGGWRMRLNLARALMCPSDVLLLDEPTNHLDFETVDWLEKWLQTYTGILLIISHDKMFLENTTSHILHITQQQAELYTGRFSQFEKLYALQLANQQANYDKLQRTKQHLQKFIDRFGAKASKAKQAQSRQKALNKLPELAPVLANNPFNFEFPSPQYRPSPLISFQNVSLGYENSTPILKSINFSLSPEARIGILGKNGEGKSTLIKSIAGELSALNGEITRAQHLSVGYFAQHQLEYLTLDASPLWHLQQLDRQATPQTLRNFLGSFAFHGDDALTPIENFSGGEKARLALALIIYQAPNLLLLDEPTNHLDMEMREALAMALQNYEGSLLMVSHDASLLELCCEDYWLIGQQQLTVFNGALDDYRQLLAQNRSATTSQIDKPSIQNSMQHAQRKQRQSDKRKCEKLIAQIEEKIEKAQLNLQHIDAQLADDQLYAQGEHLKIQALSHERQSILQDLQHLEERWLEQQTQLELLDTSL